MNSLKPAEVFKFFAEINRIPRPSKKEERMIAYLEQQYSLWLIMDMYGMVQH